MPPTIVTAELEATRKSLEKVAAMLVKAEDSYTRSQSLMGRIRSGNLGQMARLGLEQSRHLDTAHTAMRDAEHTLRADFRRVQRVVVVLEREMGKRRPPGRPRALSPRELRLAKFEREDGRSWEQIRRVLNDLRGKGHTRPPLSASTIRSAVSAGDPAKTL